MQISIATIVQRYSCRNHKHTCDLISEGVLQSKVRHNSYSAIEIGTEVGMQTEDTSNLVLLTNWYLFQPDSLVLDQAQNKVVSQKNDVLFSFLIIQYYDKKKK